MLSKVEVMEKPAFDAWYASDKLNPHDVGTPDEGEILYKTLGCVSCHSLDGSTIIGPSFKGIYGKKITVLTGGKPRTLVVDDAYLRDSVRNPAKDVVENFPQGIMPNLSDQINEKQMNAIITFIKAQSTLKNKASTQPSVAPPPITKTQGSILDGATLFNTKGCIGCHSLDGSKRVGPSLKGLYQSKQKVITEGKLHEITADTAYLHNSIQHPNADVVEGFPSGVMPPFGTILSDEEVNALVKYLQGV